MSIRCVIWRHTFPYTSITPPLRKGIIHWCWVRQLPLVFTTPFYPTTWKSSTSGILNCWPSLSQKILWTRRLRAVGAPWGGRAGPGNPSRSRALSGWAWWQWCCKVSFTMPNFIPYGQTTGAMILKLSTKGSQLCPKGCAKMEDHEKTSWWVAAAVSKCIRSKTGLNFFCHIYMFIF